MGLLYERCKSGDNLVRHGQASSLKLCTTNLHNGAFDCCHGSSRLSPPLHLSKIKVSHITFALDCCCSFLAQIYFLMNLLYCSRHECERMQQTIWTLREHCLAPPLNLLEIIKLSSSATTSFNMCLVDTNLTAQVPNRCTHRPHEITDGLIFLI
jgi:hypothetical protein